MFGGYQEAAMRLLLIIVGAFAAMALHRIPSIGQGTSQNKHSSKQPSCFGRAPCRIPPGPPDLGW
jgi:hypothetical protein